MFKTLGTIIIFLWSSLCLANISGSWQGWGDWTYQGKGEGVHCNPMSLDFVETKDKLIRTRGFFDCSFVTMEINSEEWKKEGNNLTLDGEVVGSFTENSFHITEQYSESIKLDLSIVIAYGHFDYTEVWYEKDNAILYEIKARLFKKR